MKQIKELHRLLGKKSMAVEFLKEAVEYGRAKKMDSARALAAWGYELTLISRCINVSRAQLSLHLHCSADWQESRRQRGHDDSRLVARILKHIAEVSNYGYRRVWALLRKESEDGGAETVNAKRVYRACVIITCFWKEKGLRSQPVLIAEKWLCRQATGDGAQMALSSTVITVISCGSFRSGLFRPRGAGLDSHERGYTSDIVMDVMMNSISNRFGNRLPDTPTEFLSDNVSCYTARETRAFSKQLNIEQKTTAVRSLQSNGMPESLVKTIKRDYISVMPKPDREGALINPAVAFGHYNDSHAHSALGYRSPCEYRRQSDSLT